MKAPDKIYLPKEELEERKPWIETSYKDDSAWEECYIRKDALLKWAYEDLDPAAYLQLKDKLNEM